MRQHIQAAIEELKQQRDEIDTAINALLKLEGKPVNAVSRSGQSLAKLSLYEATVRALEDKSPLTTDEVLEALKIGERKTSRVILATTLYKSVRSKKDCRIALAGKGKWKLVS